LDLCNFEGFREVFTTDVMYTSRGQTLNGVDEVIASFTRRAPGRTTRHSWSALNLEARVDGTVAGRSIWVCFAGSGPLPVPSTDIYTVADFHDTYTFTAQRWRIARRTIVPIFRDSALAPR